jgi:hypothetical protein
MPQHLADHAGAGEPPHAPGTDAPAAPAPNAGPRQLTDPDNRRAPVLDLGRC